MPLALSFGLPLSKKVPLCGFDELDAEAFAGDGHLDLLGELVEVGLLEDGLLESGP